MTIVETSPIIQRTCYSTALVSNGCCYSVARSSRMLRTPVPRGGVQRSSCRGYLSHSTALYGPARYGGLWAYQGHVQGHEQNLVAAYAISVPHTAQHRAAAYAMPVPHVT
eukprot:1421070-Rhodomonas_salina.3